MRKFIFPLLFFVIVFFFFSPVFFSHKLPIPSDTIIGLYHPYRDFFSGQYPNGIPFKNFLITDPVRQQYPWRFLGMSIAKTGNFPLWNPYSGLGSPLLANFQSAVFYPFNIFSFILSFQNFWTLNIIIQPLLAGLFLYMYLKNLDLTESASLCGAIVFAFCGFSISWLEWGTVIQTALWLPLILLIEDKLVNKFNKRFAVALIFAECSQIFAGHLQIWFYSLLVSNAYLIYIIFLKIHAKKGLLIKHFLREFLPFLGTGFIIFLISSVQLIPTFKFINESARSIDQNMWMQEGWFIPWQHLAQFIAPDFFGNPTTLNYWGVWNYAELVGYIGILPLIFVFLAIFGQKSRRIWFFIIVLLTAVLFAFPTFLAKLPFQFSIPFISTSQPTRLMFIIDLCLSVLSAYGFNLFFKTTNKKSLFPLLPVFIAFVVLFTAVFLKIHISNSERAIAKSNLIFPFFIFLCSGILIMLYRFLDNVKIRTVLSFAALILITFDLFRFGYKFTPFTQESYLFPETKTIKFLQENLRNYRFATADSRIFPPNFNIVYKISGISLYDPLYLKTYGAFVASSERGTPNISEPFGFNRIVDPHNINSNLINLMGVKYILSFEDLKGPFKKVFQEGKTKVFENTRVFPRVFFVTKTVQSKSQQDIINKMFSLDLMEDAISDDVKDKTWSKGIVDIETYTPNKIVLKTDNEGNGFIVLLDNYYPSWMCQIDKNSCKIVKTDFTFRGIAVPKGKHEIIFFNSI